MSGDEKKRRGSARSGDREAKPEEPLEPAGGAFFHAPTRTFQALPTEVLDVGSHSGNPRSEAKTRATRLPPSENRRLPTPPGTEALNDDEMARIKANREQQFPDVETDHLEMTNPDPFRVDVDSVERALFEVAREPTHHDLFIDELDGPPSETSTDAEQAPRPVSGVTSALKIEFEDPTVALDVKQQGLDRRSPLLEATDEDTALPSSSGHSLPPMDNEPPPNAEPGDRYYEEMRGVIAVARVFDPKKAPELVTDPGYRDHSDEWPEITLDRAPKPTVDAPSRSPVMLALFLVAVLIVTVSGVGIGFALQRRGVSLDDLLERGSNALAATAEGDEAKERPQVPAPVEPREAEDKETAAPAGTIDPDGAWKNRVVSLTFRGVEDASRSGVEGLDETLMKAFASAVASDEHARWRVSSSPAKRGYGFELSLQVVSVSYDDDGSAQVRCVVTGARRHEPGGEIRGDVSAVRRAEGSLAKAGPDKLAREAARACGFSLALRFFEEGLQ